MGNIITASGGKSQLRFALRAISISLLPLLLVACSVDAPVANESSEPATSSVAPSPSSSETDVLPSPEDGESQGPAGGPAFTPEEGQAGEAPVVLREDAVANPVPVEPAPFNADAVYSDGVVVATSNFSRGVVGGEGNGVVVGAEYVVFTISVRNGSPQDFDLGAVVASMIYGEDRLAAAPLYDEVPAVDLTGSLKPGEYAEGIYAFQFPAGSADPVLYLDLNGTHQPLVFRGQLP